MKRFLGIIISLLAFTNCDDGDFAVDNIDFSQVTAKSCANSNLVFKLKDSEALILNFPTTVFTTDPSPVGEPVILKINSENQVVYNFYNGKVADANICDLIPPATPSINKQLNATEGTIEIATSIIYTKDETNNSTRISGYNYNIVFKNIKFTKADGTFQLYETLVFGDYFKTLDPKIPFVFSGVLKQCTSNGEVYDFSANESLTLSSIETGLIANVVTPVGSPRVATIGLTKNKLTYRLFNSVLKPEYFCQPTTPLIPTINQTWEGKVGGTIEVTTTTNGPNSFLHTIILKSITMEKGTSNFFLGTSYKYGELQTTN